MIWVALGVVTALVLWYALWGRMWLKRQEWAKGFFAVVEPVEIFLWRKSETLLWARFLMLLGIIPPLLEQFDALKPLLEVLAPYMPEEWQHYMSLTFTVLGIIGEIQRRYTTKPLTLVEIPESKPMPIEVEVAMARAESAKHEAVAVVGEARAEGAV